MNIKDYKPGMVVKVPGFVQQLSWHDSPTWHPTELSASGYITICPCALTFIIPEGFNCIQAEVASIDAALKSAREAYHSTVTDLVERKQALLQLPAPQDTQEVLDAETNKPLIDLNF